jgi:hypothetical protein
MDIGKLGIALWLKLEILIPPVFEDGKALNAGMFRFTGFIACGG